jgi:tetratricopeptide (TPR) repeat protein
MTFQVFLFLCCILSAIASKAQDFSITYLHFEQYQQALKLEKASRATPPASLADAWIQGYQTTLPLLFFEQEVLYAGARHRLEELLLFWENQPKTSPKDLYVYAELQTQLALLHFRYRRYWSAAWAFRAAYRNSRRAFYADSTFSGNRKLWGVLQCVMGAVPSEYQWIASVVGMPGNYASGIKLLRSIPPNDVFYKESLLIRILLIDLMPESGYVLNEEELSRMHLLDDSPLAKLLFIRRAMQSHADSVAMGVIAQVSEENFRNTPLFYYLAGELAHRSLDFEGAKAGYKEFLSHCANCDLSKDAWYKIGLLHWYTQDTAEYLANCAKALEAGHKTVEADRYAQKQAKTPLPGVIPLLTMGRYSMDGGYYTSADSLYRKAKPLLKANEQLEYMYRIARLLELQGRYKEANKAYTDVVASSATRGTYFGPYAAYRLATWHSEQKNFRSAKEWIAKAKKFRNYAYEQSLRDKVKKLEQTFP